MAELASGGGASPRAGRTFLGAPLGWWVVAACAVCVALGQSSFLAVTFGQFLPAFTGEFHAPPPQIVVAITVTVYTTVIVSPVVGLLMDRFSPDRILLAGSVLVPISLVAFSFIGPQLPQLYAAAALVAVCGAATLPITYTAIVLRWFDRRRGIALGVVMSGVGLATLVLPLILQPLIAAQGWRFAMRALAGISVVVVPILLLTVVTRLRPASEAERDGGLARSAAPLQDEENAPAPPLGAEIRDSRYLRVGFAYFLVGLGNSAVATGLMAVLLKLGFARPDAAYIFAFYGFVLMAARILAGLALDRLPPTAVAFVVTACPAAGFLLMMIGGAAVAPAMIAAALFAVGFGAEFDVLSIFISRLYSRANYGRLYGVVYGTFTLGTGLGPLILAFSVARSGNYQTGLIALAVAVALAAVQFLTFKLPARRG